MPLRSSCNKTPSTLLTLTTEAHDRPALHRGQKKSVNLGQGRGPPLNPPGRNPAQYLNTPKVCQAFLLLEAAESRG